MNIEEYQFDALSEWLLFKANSTILHLIIKCNMDIEGFVLAMKQLCGFVGIEHPDLSILFTTQSQAFVARS